MTIERKGRRKTRPLPIIISLLILGLLLVAGFFTLKSWITGALVDVQPLSRSVLEEQLEADFLIIRDEHILSAPFSGKLELVAQEGEKVPKGAVVAYLSKVEGTSLEATAKIPLTAPAAGIFSLALDGLESICNSQTWSQIDLQKLPGLEKGLEKKAPGNAKEKEITAAGTPLGKIMDNLSPCYVFLETEQLVSERIKLGKSVEIRLPQLAEEPLQGTVRDFSQVDGKNRILIQVVSVSDIEKYRRVAGQLILAKYEGMVVPENLLVKKDNLIGVYLFKDGHAVWQEVKVRGQVDNMVALAGLQADQWIITTPSLVREGQRVFRSKG